MKRNQFTFYRSFLDAMCKLPEELWLAYLANIVFYGLDEETPMEMNYIQAGMFELVRPNLDAARKKAQAGQRGGRATKASKQVSKIENEIEIENEVEIECESNKRQEANGTHRENFEKFWNLYPVKIGKEKAWGVWQHMLPDPVTVCQSLELWMKSRQWTQEGTRFVPLAENFLKQEYFRQRPEVAAPCGALGQLGEAEMKALEKIMRED